MRDVTQRFPLDRVDHDEFVDQCLGHFGRGGPVRERRQQFYRESPVAALQITASESGRVTHVEATDELPDSELEALVRSVRERLVEKQDLMAGLSVLFCTNTTVNGYFCYRDRFQIEPAPAGWPRPQYVVGDHPFLVRFQFTGSVDRFLTHRRRMAQTIHLSRYLNVLLSPPVSVGRRTTEFAYVLENEGDPANITSRWAQTGYIPTPVDPGALPLQAPRHAQPFPHVDPTLYYYSGFTMPSNELAIPADLEASLDRIYALAEDARERFDIATAWLSHSGDIWRGSASASFAALVIAVEALLERIPPEQCECCGQDKFASTQRFKGFLTRYVPGIEAFQEVLTRLYRVRSKVVHGDGLFAQDLTPWRFLSMRAIEEMDLFHSAQHLIRIAVYHWLLEAH